MADKDKEITSYNKGLMSFDFDDMSVEELERRFELASALLAPDLLSCSGFDCVSAFMCVNFTCSARNF